MPSSQHSSLLGNDSDLDDEEEEALRRRSFTSRPRRGNHNSVPLFVFVAYFMVTALQGFIFFSIWWRIVPYTRRTMNLDRDQATIVAQIYLLIDYLTTIGAGLLSDFKCTRYKLIFITSSIFFFSYGILLTVGYFIPNIPMPYRGFLFGILLFCVASSTGMTTSMVILFGIEQLDNDSDDKARTRFLRTSAWIFQIGCCIAYPFIVFENRVGEASTLIILGASAFQIPLFVFWKRFYKLNVPGAGMKTMKHLRAAFRRCIGQSEEVQETQWQISDPEPSESSDHVRNFQRALLRRVVLLVLIFFSFGPYLVDFFMSNIVFPIQANEMANETHPDTWYYVSYDARASVTILLSLPLLDFLFNSFACFNKYFTNFVQVGVAMGFATLSLGTATLTHYFFGPKAKGPQFADEEMAKDAFLTMEYVFMGVAKALYITGGYDIAYVESPPFLKGTAVGLFTGLGSVFGALVFFIQYYTPPIGVNHETWPYGMVFGILTFSILFMYIPLVKVYIRARTEFRQIRNSVDDEFQEFSTEYRSIQSK